MKLFGEMLDAVLRDDRGAFGESLVDLNLRIVKFFGREGVTLRNLYVPKENGETSEIDLLYITKKCIFVIESKNYSGWIFGKEQDMYWTQRLSNGHKEKFYNPIKQNQTHIKWLLNYLGEDIPVFSMIVFSERCELKSIDFQVKRTCVCKRDELYGSIRYIWKRLEDTLSEEKIAQIAEKLTPLTQADAITRQAHIDDINRKYHKSAEPAAPPELAPLPEPEPTPEPVPEPALLCPKCGAPLVLRTAKRGANTGGQFYGCSAFPKCRYILKPEEPTKQQ